MKKRIVAILLGVIALFSLVLPGFALSGDDTALSAVSQNVVDTVENWLYDNFGEFYDIRDVDITIKRTFDNGTETNYTVAVYCMTKLKAQSVEDLPFVQGLHYELSTRCSTDALATDAIDYYVSTIDFSDEYEVLTVDVVVPVSNSNQAAALTTLYVQDGMDTSLHPIEELELDADEMYLLGRTSVDMIISSYQDEILAASTMGYSSYDRIAARDYALNWTGINVTACYDCGTSCGILQDRTQWNNTEYPYITTLKHNDCCDFVSQCIYAGGIPTETGKWDRFYDGDNNWAWTYVPGLKSYMTGKGYWDTSTYAAANAGNILYWDNGSHIALITLNDTVCHRFTAHTNDRNNYCFSDSTSYSYYTIKTT